MPATLGSRLRAREALRASRAPRPGRGQPPDLTFWVIAGGIGTFLVLLLVAGILFTVSIIAKNNAAPTAAVAVAPIQTQAATPATPPTLAPTTVAQTPQPPGVSPTPIKYTVQPGDTLGGIANVFQVSPEEIQQANGITDPNLLFAGQILIIPVDATGGATFPAQATPLPLLTTPESTAAAPAARAGVPRSILDGDLNAGYPLSLSGQRVTIHYQPGSFTDVNGPQLILNYAEQTLGYIEQTLGVQYSGPLDVYFAGSLFAAPDQALRGRAFSTQRRLFVLYDGSGTPAERRYMLAHEMTHVVAWNTLGPPSSVMLSEGLATYVGQPYLDNGEFIKYQDFCRALNSAQRLPSLTTVEKSTQDFLGHIRSLYNYNTAACFIGHLFALKGAAAFAQLYPTSNYTGNYGAGLGQLQAGFERELAAGASQVTFDSNRLVQLYDEVRKRYDVLLSAPDPNMKAYEKLDKARIAVMKGDFDQAQQLLDSVP